MCKLKGNPYCHIHAKTANIQITTYYCPACTETRSIEHSINPICGHRVCKSCFIQFNKDSCMLCRKSIIHSVDDDTVILFNHIQQIKMDYEKEVQRLNAKINELKNREIERDKQIITLIQELEKFLHK